MREKIEIKSNINLLESLISDYEAQLVTDVPIYNLIETHKGKIKESKLDIGEELINRLNRYSEISFRLADVKMQLGDYHKACRALNRVSLINEFFFIKGHQKKEKYDLIFSNINERRENFYLAKEFPITYKLYRDIFKLNDELEQYVSNERYERANFLKNYIKKLEAKANELYEKEKDCLEINIIPAIFPLSQKNIQLALEKERKEKEMDKKIIKCFDDEVIPYIARDGKEE